MTTRKFPTNLFGMLIVMAIAIFLSLSTISCKKDNGTAPQSDVSFSVNSVLNQGLKSSSATANDTIICSDKTPDYIKVKIDALGFKVITVFPSANNKYFSNSIKLNTGSHTINEFLVYSNNNTPIDSTDDVLLSATPHTTTAFASYVTTPLTYNFNVATDQKTSTNVDVVCFTPQNFTKFGFEYFSLTEINIRQLWFFGDFCVKSKLDYLGSAYNQQTNWGNPNDPSYIDAPTIAKVEVYRNQVLQNTFANSDQGEKISVTYGDIKNQVDVFELKLYILVKQGTQFNYVLFKSFSFNDVSNIPQGNDGVIDYVLGNCYDPQSPPDLILAPYMNLPQTAKYTITAWNPSHVINGLQGYVDATLANIGSGYDIHNGTYASNCADHGATIIVGLDYNMDVYSSLYQEKLPVFAQSSKWNKINWLFNNLDRYPNYHWYDIQGVIWLYDTNPWDGSATYGMPALTSLSSQMKADADVYGVNYVPSPSGWAAVIFVPMGTLHNAPTATIQTMFIQIDP